MACKEEDKLTTQEAANLNKMFDAVVSDYDEIFYLEKWPPDFPKKNAMAKKILKHRCNWFNCTLEDNHPQYFTIRKTKPRARIL